MEGYLNIVDAAAYLNISRSKLYKMVKDNEIPCYRPGRSIRFTQAELDAWMLNRRVATDEELARKVSW